MRMLCQAIRPEIGGLQVRQVRLSGADKDNYAIQAPKFGDLANS